MTKPEMIPITKPVFDHEEEALLLEVLRSGWVVQGPKVAQFEERFAQYTGAEHAVATTSCTTALHLALIAAGVGPGDQVLVPAFTWVASANVVEYVGAEPVFCDIDLATFTLDIEQVEQRLTAKTKAMIPVSLFGLCPDMAALQELAARHNITLIEDAACSLGSRFGKYHAGRFGLGGCFSFHPRKAVTTGEGGMFITDDAEAAALCRAARDHGSAVSDLTRHQGRDGFLLSQFGLLGYNYRMTDLQGALGVAQMKKAPQLVAQRRQLAAQYRPLLASVKGLELPLEPAGRTHSYQSYVCLFRPQRPTLDNVDQLHRERNQLMAALDEQGIATRQGTHAVHLLDYYRGKYGLQPQDFPMALLADRLSLTLPLFCGMSADQQQRVADQIAALMEG